MGRAGRGGLRRRAGPHRARRVRAPAAQRSASTWSRLPRPRSRRARGRQAGRPRGPEPPRPPARSRRRTERSSPSRRSRPRGAMSASRCSPLDAGRTARRGTKDKGAVPRGRRRALPRVVRARRLGARRACPIRCPDHPRPRTCRPAPRSSCTGRRRGRPLLGARQRRRSRPRAAARRGRGSRARQLRAPHPQPSSWPTRPPTRCSSPRCSPPGAFGPGTFCTSTTATPCPTSRSSRRPTTTASSPRTASACSAFTRSTVRSTRTSRCATATPCSSPAATTPSRRRPGYDLYYLNVMAGPTRAWAIANDPDHDWMLR